MSEIDDMLSGILNDPNQMKKIMDMASSFMGSSDMPKPEKQSEPDTANILSDVSKFINPEMLSSVTKFMGSSKYGTGDKTALFAALKPWLSEERGKKLDKAVKLAVALRVARIFFKKSEADS